MTVKKKLKTNQEVKIHLSRQFISKIVIWSSPVSLLSVNMLMFWSSHLKLTMELTQVCWLHLGSSGRLTFWKKFLSNQTFWMNWKLQESLLLILAKIWIRRQVVLVLRSCTSFWLLLLYRYGLLNIFRAQNYWIIFCGVLKENCLFSPRRKS